MATKTLTDDDGDGFVSFVQTVEDVDGDSLDVVLELDEIDGVTQSGGDRTPPWLSYNVFCSLEPDGTRKCNLSVEIDTTQLGNPGTTYTFEATADDGVQVGTCRFDFTIPSLVTGGMFILDGDDDEIRDYELDSPWDLSGASLNQSFEVIGHVSLFFRPNGEILFILDQVDDNIQEYTLSTAWDISTASLNQSLDISAQDTFALRIFFKPDGTKMYYQGGTNKEIFEYNLSTAWDISTASFNQKISVEAQDSLARGLFFRPDGSQMYIGGNSTDSILEYTLSTAWDISTASFNQSLDISAQDTQITSVFFKDDGTKMFMLGSDSDSVHEYTLSVAWDISSASLVDSLDISIGTTASPHDLHFSGPV